MVVPGKGGRGVGGKWEAHLNVGSYSPEDHAVMAETVMRLMFLKHVDRTGAKTVSMPVLKALTAEFAQDTLEVISQERGII